MSVKTLQIEVREDTASAIQKAADTIGLSQGEIVDRLVAMRMAKSTDADTVALLMLEYFMIYSTYLNPEEFQKALQRVQKFLTEQTA